MKIFGFEIFKQKPFYQRASAVPGVVDVYDLPQASSGVHSGVWDGEKFPGGFGDTIVNFTDYWSLRLRSTELFNQNMYANGLIKRLVTNEINTGLSIESCPEESILGLESESLDDWTEDVETRFMIWGKSPKICDLKKQSTFGAIQVAARMEALISGDVLVILRPGKSGLSAVQLVSGNAIQTPFDERVKIKKGHKIEHGVELDQNGIQVAFWVSQDDNFSFKRIPAISSTTGRNIAWLVYGTDKRLDDVRGTPLLSLILQSMKEMDRYRDSVQRKATINSMLAMFIKKTSDKPGSLPLSGGALRKTEVTASDNGGVGRTLKIADMIPGMAIETLQEGEEPVGFNSQGIDLSFGPFEETIISAIAWANEIPPEILKLAFSNNYSASQAAINEFKIYLNKIRTTFGDTFCQPIYVDWLLSEVLLGRIKAPGLLEAWRDPAQYDKFGSWIFSDWSGAIKPSTDIKKQAQGYRLLNEDGLITSERSARELTGTKFAKNIKRIKRENIQKAEAARPLLELKREFGESEANEALSDVVETAISDSVINE